MSLQKFTDFFLVARLKSFTNHQCEVVNRAGRFGTVWAGFGPNFDLIFGLILGRILTNKLCRNIVALYLLFTPCIY